MQKLTLTVVSQERKLLETEVESVSAITTQGEITILARHIPLFTQLKTGELRYFEGEREHSIVVSDGFLTVNPNNEVIVMVDSATLARDISVAQAEEAISAAKETMKISENRRELIMAEASLKRAMLEIKVAQKRGL
ncbi:MAG: ATP synthase F1 subunit epsilon [Candidatus Pacebacteria bacterium CG_4_9_14_3_um_filter_40_12]|nr:ATP synthase F1 subunit epsilon [Candidatus Paceibacterota bacterium]PIR63122.1 MAG: ATP synthase F1 subunit epsilon [Candidatus Pacebacteria bacterium CG10_big_fil_rev_8_21_14_0_10_40_26]PIZ78508.1 MAG: ATP synthase F1 subunit epsilon [Candidatus Pacebacteria bacterium CG_4_10_14_0_2_um_filter_40_20]PJA69359.1 MAG: ATP synthase F1 subunit epsilon [Candidatus Pacebacteria bacterium CG_4_9_14_3_um_filter_40_12]PJC41376.1 MAG: ATP synthase F1 subunit epsilon [Candidatus Pacebacteria bacterium 